MAPDSFPEPIRVAIDIAAKFERLDIPYLAVGSLASSLHGAPRSTDDIDFVVSLDPARAQRLVAALSPEYYVSEAAAREAAAAPRGGSFNTIHLPTAVKVDLFVAGDDPFDAERLRRRGRVRLSADHAAELFVDTAEYTVLRKLEWYRRGGEVSERQWSDVVAVLRAQGARLDRSAMDQWAQRLGISDLLQRGRLEVE
jgi:hypothetical protein